MTPNDVFPHDTDPALLDPLRTRYTGEECALAPEEIAAPLRISVDNRVTSTIPWA